MKYGNMGTLDHWKVIFLGVFAGICLADEPTIICEPRELRGMPGEPLRLMLTIETDRITPFRVRIPAVRNLFLRAVEKIPVQRNDKGRYLQQRVILWQGIESGQSSITNLVVEFQSSKNHNPKGSGSGAEKGGRIQSVPSIEVIIYEVAPAEPPEQKTKEEE